LKLKYEELLAHFAFNLSMRPYSKGVNAVIYPATALGMNGALRLKRVLLSRWALTQRTLNELHEVRRCNLKHVETRV